MRVASNGWDLEGVLPGEQVLEGDQGLHKHPFGIGQIARITKATAVGGKAVFGLPHRALPLTESSAQQ